MDELILKKLNDFFSQYKHQFYKKGEIIIRADDNPAGIFFLKKGNIKEYAISKKGEELVVNIFKPKAFFPMNWAINSTPNAYYFEAMSAVELWRAPKDKVLELLKNNPEILFDLLSRVYKGTDGLLKRMTHLMSGGAYPRLLTELIIHAKRFGDKKGKQFILGVSEKELAAQSGMTRETVSREIKILKNKGFLEIGKNVIIKDLQKLEDELKEGF